MCFDSYYQDLSLNLCARVRRIEIVNKVLKISGVDTSLSVIKLTKIYTIKNKRRENNIQMERDYVNRTIIVSTDLFIIDISNHLLS